MTQAVQNQPQGNLCYHGFNGSRGSLSLTGWDVFAKHTAQTQSWQFEDMMGEKQTSVHQTDGPGRLLQQGSTAALALCVGAPYQS